MAYSNTITVHLITGRNPKAKQPLHVEFANLRDEPEAIMAFTKRWRSPGVDNEPDVKRTLLLRDVLRGAWRGDKSCLDGGPIMSVIFAAIHVTAERIEVKPSQLVETASLLFMRDRLQGKTAICENPECPAPYFLRKRKTQKFCEAGPCVEYGARLRANKWWHAHGDEWREQRRNKSGGKK